jgi:hypothetical protein
VDGGLRGGPFAPEQTFTFGASAPPRIVEAAFAESGEFRLRFTGTAGASYRVQTATRLGGVPEETPWEIAGPATAEGGEFFSFLDAGAAGMPARVYRIIAD